MISEDEDALVCDLAETYQIYDYKQLPPTKVAVFCLGLRENSRIKMKLSGQTVPFDIMLLAAIADRLSTLVWFQTKDGQKGRNRPQMLTNLLTNAKKKESEVEGYHSGEEFDKARKLLGGE